MDNTVRRTLQSRHCLHTLVLYASFCDGAQRKLGGLVIQCGLLSDMGHDRFVVCLEVMLPCSPSTASSRSNHTYVTTGKHHAICSRTAQLAEITRIVKSQH